MSITHDGQTRVLPAPELGVCRFVPGRGDVWTFRDDAAWLRAKAPGGPLAGILGASEYPTECLMSYKADDTPDSLLAKRQEGRERRAGLRGPIEDTLSMRLGLWCEPFLFAEYARARPDRGCEIAAGKIVFVDPTGNLLATPDGWCWDLDRPEIRWPLQVKMYSEFYRSRFASQKKANKGERSIPDFLLGQCGVEALCCGTTRASYFALCGNRDPYQDDLDFGPDFAASALEVGRVFKQAVDELIGRKSEDCISG